MIKGVAMLLRRRRLHAKAAPAPNRGRGPGTSAAGGPRINWIVSPVPSRVQVPIRPVVVKPSPVRVWPAKVASETMGPLEYLGSIAKDAQLGLNAELPHKIVAIPLVLVVEAVTDPLKNVGPLIPKVGIVDFGPVHINALADSMAPGSQSALPKVVKGRLRLPLALTFTSGPDSKML